MKMPLPVRQHWQGLHSRGRTTIHNYFTRLSGERKGENMDYREKIMECIGRISDKERLELICRFAERLSEREDSHGTERESAV